MQLGASFRDPSGFMYTEDGILYRQINKSYQAEYDQLMESGLYDELVKKGLLVKHDEVDKLSKDDLFGYKVIQPQPIDFISYPFEWCFSQLKDAALLTLEINQLALAKGMILKDASAYNVQFQNGRPVFIDTLSFAKYNEGEPWIAYGQFCRHFLAPLALIQYNDAYFNQWFRINMDGIPLDFAAKNLPFKTKFKFGLLSHLHMHAKVSVAHSDDRKATKVTLSKFRLQALLESLASTVKAIKWKPAGMEWTDYYSATNYSDPAFQKKKDLIISYLDEIGPANIHQVWDLGGNTGEFGNLAAQKGITTLSFDRDLGAIENSYLYYNKDRKETKLLPLHLDLQNPSGFFGWGLEERDSIVARSSEQNCIFALAVIHHLAISNNTPLGLIAKFMQSLGNHLIIEFVPKEDSQVERLLATREDIFPEYTIEGFEASFGQYYEILKKERVGDSQRTLFLLRRK